jgi:ADP-heptose:LPS heptosyltransferase
MSQFQPQSCSYPASDNTEKNGLDYGKAKAFTARCLEQILRPPALALSVRKRPRKTVSNILIAEPYHLGDAASIAVMLSPLKQRFPGADIHLLIADEVSGLYEDDKRVNYTHKIDVPWRKRERKYRIGNWPRMLRLRRKLKEIRKKFDFDIGFDVRGDIRNQLLLLLCGCRRRVGSTNYLGSNIRIRGHLLTESCGDFPLHHITELNLRLCRKVGCEVDLEPALPALLAPAGKREDNRKQIIVHTRGGSKYKRWQTAKWIELCRRLSERGQVWLVGTQGESEDLARIAASAGKGTGVCITPTLQELITKLSKSDVFVGLDSGPANIASMLDKPAVVLFGPGVVHLYRPISRFSVALAGRNMRQCSPCVQKFCSYNTCICLAEISVDKVVETTLSVLDRIA